MKKIQSLTKILTFLMATSLVACEVTEEPITQNSDIQEDPSTPRTNIISTEDAGGSEPPEPEPNPNPEPYEPEPEPSEEECDNGYDDDLDGEVDETSCDFNETPLTEFCDGVDNDLDGSVDEGINNCVIEPPQCLDLTEDMESATELSQLSDSELCEREGFSPHTELCYQVVIPDGLEPGESGAYQTIHEDCQYFDYCLPDGERRMVLCLPAHHQLAVDLICGDFDASEETLSNDERCVQAGFATDNSACYIEVEQPELEDGESGAIPPEVHEDCVKIDICYSAEELGSTHCLPADHQLANQSE